MGSIVTIPIVFGLSLLAASPAGILGFFKWIVSYVYIEITRRMTKKRFDLYDFESLHEPSKVGFLPPQREYDLESPQQDSHLLSNADAVFLYGVNSDSECLIVRIGRTVSQQVEAWIYLRLKGGKTYKLSETAGFENSNAESGREFTFGGLRVNYMKPMRRWRIFYNGMLRETSEEAGTLERMVYVKFALIWRATSDSFDLTADVPSGALAKGFAGSEWKAFTPPLDKFKDIFNFYAQSGNIVGTVQVEEGTEDRILNLFGERMRFLGSNKLLKKGAVFTHILGRTAKDGSIFHVAEATVPDVVNRFQFGFLVLPNGVIASISNADIVIGNDSYGVKKNVTALFQADGIRSEVKAEVVGQSILGESAGGSVSVHNLKIKMNDFEGSGLLLKGEVKESPGSNEKAMKITRKPDIPKDIPYAVHFSEKTCEFPEVTGGKGSSLGILMTLSKEYQTFIVPNGIVVTTTAYDLFLNEETKGKIKSLENILYGNTAGSVKEACQRVMNEIIKAEIPNQALNAVTACLRKAFGDEFHSIKFAVRSSATGEDTEQMSAAGQMETFLGISGLDEILLAVKKCWASQFDFIAVQYKKQNGQMVNSPMAVVIQEMVPCDVAGVLFTCDPLTGNPSLMTITANYGLGESVVSGSEEPDTIVLTRNVDDKLEVKDKIIGAKERRFVIKGDQGTSLEEVSENEKQSCSLPDRLSLRLGNVAVQIEKSYRSKRDIEWGFWNNNLYIFQSRPITSGTGETDFEIEHETDAPMRIENEYFTVCNVGEVMPGATSTLGMDILMKYFNVAMMQRALTQWQSVVKPKYYPKAICHMYNHVMIYLTDLLERASEGRHVIDGFMVGMFGRVIDDENLYEIAMLRHKRRKKTPAIFNYYGIFRCLTGTESRLQKALKNYADYHLPVENLKNSQDIFDTLGHACDDLNEAMMVHMIATQSSSIFNMFVISIIQKDAGVLKSDAYTAFSKLLSSIKDVESADVPSAMQSLAYQIGKDMNPEDLRKMDNKEMLQWLNTTTTDAGIKFRDFLKKHGHRCLKEFDIRSTTWGTDPTLLIQLLKNLVGNVRDSSPKNLEDFDKILDGLQLGRIKRAVLKFLLPRCRKAVQLREASKSLLIKSQDKWRKGYWHLARVMVSEGRIPDADLLFFMNLEEIREFLVNRSSKIIARANHRRRRHADLDKYIFPEIMCGFPHPVNLHDAPCAPTEDDFMMKGIPVSQGVAKGFLRVALTLEEASHLKPGEILLTYSTDIGWTPYFPTLAGVVTELGGLISHGAVVSREYGLPCIAGLHGGTRQFQTGDYVLLDGNKGILQKMPPPES